MEKKSECEIVQDLLIGDIDGVLSKSSKKLVDRHLLECNECRQNLENLQQDIKESEQTKIKKEIDYLKKYRRKSKIKSVITAILIVFIIFFAMYLYKFLKLNNLVCKYANTLKCENFYTEQISYDEMYNTLFIDKTWYKDGKYKKVTYQKEEGKEEEVLWGVTYGEIGNKQEITIYEKDKNAVKVNNPFTKEKKHILSAPNPIGSGYESYIFRLGAPFYATIKKDTYLVGKEYYIINLNKSELWIDKDTGLPIKDSGYSASIEHYEGTDIVKEVHDKVTNYRYQFDIVKDEDVDIPDLTNYTVTENNSLVELMNDANQG